ncbi:MULTISPECIES: hypothetical protein [Halobacterium]|uniref:DUF7332 family protein n=1 Tax=Halobacterium TaxID=2239 RepID=UPI001E479C46|nr:MULTISPECIES: hypothetical protein [Halobacterium]MDL0123240.1 hypothetical protein [Halobacterium salinarum]MDL0128305.1 hypothetical protein [Halobacterium salinarum]MDL0134595.1 hypothetical protein [Halobacterium salinarum]QRY25830.2 hypothetical protein JRZ79_01465 [Halobacterium sp. BOL4-2]WJK64284.1 hypothetical protein QSJ49_03925 [Halobacterium salinarum]
MNRPPLRAIGMAIVVLVAFTGGGAAQQAGSGPKVDGDGGYRFDVGGDSPHITFWLHLDLLTNLGGAGDLGFSAVGTALDTRVIVIDLQLQFDGIGPLEEFLSDPFSRFSVSAEWELNLPFLSAGPASDTEFSYEGNETIANNTSLENATIGTDTLRNVTRNATQS